MDTKLLELETGVTQNESVTWAVRSAIEAATLAMIEQGDERGYWEINYPPEWEEVETIESTPIQDADAILTDPGSRVTDESSENKGEVK